MFYLNPIKFIKFPIALVTMLVLVFGFFCMGLFHKAPMHMEGMETNMVTMQADPSCCGMGISGHMDSWRQVSQTIPRDFRDVLILLALGLITLVAVWRPPSVLKFFDIDFIAYRLYLRSNPDLINFNHLKLAFARGILNPKIY